MAVAGGLTVAGLLFYSYPLHRPGDPGNPRTAHWSGIKVPCLFIEGTNDPFCDLRVLEAHLPKLSAPAELLIVEGADHGLKVAKNKSATGRGQAEQEIIKSLMPQIVEWLNRLS